MRDIAESSIPLWLDCDPGHDDAFAILLAAYHPGLKLLGISTTFGNTSLEKTTQNACSLLTAMNKHNDIPVYPGAPHAIARPPMKHPTDIHGESGIDGTTLLPVPKKGPATTVDTTEAIATALLAQPKNTACLVATGAYTNIALLVQRYPHIVDHIKMLSVMGGAFGNQFTDAPLGTIDGEERVGNYTQWAEFNIIADPEAATMIFGNEELLAKTVIMPLDLTHQVLATEEVRNSLLYGTSSLPPREAKSTLRQMLVDLLMFFAKTYEETFSITAGSPLHDPLAVAAVLIGSSHEILFRDFDHRNEEQFGEHERFIVKVTTEGSYEDARLGKTQTGRTILRRSSRGAMIPRSLDTVKFWTVLEQCIQRADSANERAIIEGR